MKREGYPLQWPEGVERTKKPVRSTFKCTAEQARKGIYNQISLMGGKDAMITSNIPIRKDGEFYAGGMPVGGEIGIAVYFTWNGVEYVVSCDKYDRLMDNLRGCERIIEAIRKIEYWGSKSTMQQAFKGFQLQLPQASSLRPTWWEKLLQVDRNDTPEEIEKQFKALRKYYHPDSAFGNEEMFKTVYEAYEQAKKEGRV